MGAPYAGNPASFPVDYIIPDDADPPTAAAVNVGLEALGDRTAWLKAHLPFLSSVSVTATGTVVVPPLATHAIYEGCGGGGGGAGGCSSAGSARNACGGAGGGGALHTTGIIGVAAGETLNIAIGAGGLGGSHDAFSRNGSDGDDSSIVRATGAIVLATLRGAEGGHAGIDDNQPDTVTFNGVATPYYQVTAGGAPVRHVTGNVAVSMNTLDGQALYSSAPQCGGRGISRNVDPLCDGNCSSQGFRGGSAGGSYGVDSGTYRGGGRGGGGGAGPYGDGANGGGGGPANNAGVGSPGGSGQSALSNSGAGGGGGGAAGGGSVPGGIGGNGGAGGSGRLTLTYLRGA